MKYKKWKIPYDFGRRPSDHPGLASTPLLSRLLRLRGIGTPEEAQAFLESGSDLLEDPFALDDMEKAVARIKAAAEKGERIAVYGDYDVDGISAACLLHGWLLQHGFASEPYIPDRLEEGYGLNSAAISALSERGVSLIITVDCGVTAFAETEFARSLGVDMVITDHHECAEGPLPDAVAVVDPKRRPCGPGYTLAGVGVAFKLICALDGDTERVVRDFAWLAAIGTVSDVVPLLGENRFLVKAGLERLNSDPPVGIFALIRGAGLEGKKITSSTVSFGLAPRLNAAGRLGCAGIAGRLLLTGDPEEAASLAARLCELNRERQALEQQIWNEAVSMLEDHIAGEPIVLASGDWHQGVIGIAASRLAEAYSVPAVIISLENGTGKGSCRSYNGFNLYEAVSACSEHLTGFGGHALAAGLTIEDGNLLDFKRHFSEYYCANAKKCSPALEIDLRVDSPKLLCSGSVTALEALEPYGSKNQKPCLCLCDALLLEAVPVCSGKHMRLRIKRFSREYECIFFGGTLDELGLAPGARVDVAFFPQINEFHGQRSVQLVVADVRPTDPLPLCRFILLGGAPSSFDVCGLIPSRPDFVVLWKRLKELGRSFSAPISEFMKAVLPDMRPGMMCICLRVMEELGIAAVRFDGETVSAELMHCVEKVNIENSDFLKRLKTESGT